MLVAHPSFHRAAHSQLRVARTALRSLSWLLVATCALVFVLLPATATATTTGKPSVRVSGAANLDLPDPEGPHFNEAVTDAVARGAAAASVNHDESASAVVVVTVKWADDRRIDYVGQIEVQDGDLVLALRGFDCEMCGTDELLKRVESEVALALGAVTWPDEGTAAAASTEGEPSEDPDSGTVTAGDGDTATEPKPGRRLTALGYGGIGIAGLGVGAVVAGAVLFVRDDEIDLRPDDSRGPVWVKTSRPPAIGLLAAGGGAIAIGATLLAVDLIRGKRRAVAVTPTLGPRMTGLSVQGRF